MVYILYLFISILGLSLAGDTILTIYSISSVSYSTSSTYRIVSLEGGAYLYIKGAGFSSISPSNNKVSIGGVDCPIIEFLTTNTQVVCLVPPSDTETTVQVTVTSDGTRTGTCTSCYLRYYYYNTPILAYMIPSAGNPGQEVDYYGRSRVPSSQYVDYIKIGDYRCNANDQNEFDAVTFTGSYLSAPCNLPVIEAGYYSVSQRNRVYTGYAKNLNSLPVYRYGNDPYDFAIVPQITSISNNIGSSEGQILTIKGVGFSSTGQNEVYLADTECTIIMQSETEIECELQARNTVTTPIPDQGYHAGLKFAFYQGGTLSTALSGGTPTSTGSKLTFEIGYGIGSYYSDKTSGYFKAPVTGDYTFFMSADDQAQLFISTTPLVKTGLQQIISITSYSYYRCFYKSADMNQVSNVISLVADNYYYMELYHAQGSGDNFATVGVQIPNSPNTVNTLPEVKLIKINCDTIFEILEFSISATGGYWRIRLDYLGSDGITITSSLKTGNMTYNAAASTVSSAISGSLGLKNTAVRNMLKSDGTVTTNSSEAKVYQYTVTLQSIRHNGKLPVIETSNLIGTSVYGQVSQSRVPSPAVGGTFTISAKNTTADMDYDESESSMESKLRTMGYLDPIRVVLNGDTDLGAGWRIQFSGDRVPLDEFTISYSLTGCSAPPNITVSTIQSASDDLFYEVIPVDYLFTAEDNPQITVKSNGITGNCPGFNCDYVIQDTGIPVVTTASYSAPTLTLSVDGVATGDYTSDQIRVFFGNTECTVTTYDDSSIPASLIVDCPAPEAGDYTPKVHFNDLGYASTDPSIVPITVNLVISTVTPAQINANGGTALTITGTGFPASSDVAAQRGMAINLDSATCTIDSVTPTQIICISTPVTADSALTISLNGQTATSATLTLLPAVDVPTITSVTPDSVSPVLQTTITIVGSDFDSDTSSTTITLSNSTNSQVAECVPDSASSSSAQIICNLFGAPTGNYLLTVITSLGSSNSMPFSVNTIITSVSPSSGSTAGGTTLTIQGRFFSNDMEQTLVYIGTDNIACDVTSSAPSQVQCVTRAKSDSYDETPQVIVVTTRLVEESVCDTGATCTFSYLDALTPQVTALGATSVSPGYNLEITGSGLDSDPAGTPPTVNIGGIDCAIVSNSDTQIIATVPLNVVPSQSSVIIVNVAGKGNALFTSVNATITVTPKIITVIPSSGSTAGSLLTITGAGFQTGATIKVGTTACDIRSLTSTVITCKSASTGEISLTYGNFTGIKCSPTCTLTTSSTLTPTITSVSPLSPSDPTAFTLTIIGTKFTVGTPVSVNLISKTDKTIIFAGSITTISTATQIVADFSNVAAGTYSVEVQSGASIASSTVIVTVPLSAAVPTPIVSSIAGGVTLTITGSGFFDNPQNTNNKVSVCGFSCPVTQSTPTSIDCQVPLYINRVVQTAYPGLVTTSLLVAPVSWSDTGKQSTVLDLAYTTVYSSSKADCQIGFDIGAGLLAQISEIKFFPSLAITASKFNAAVIEGSSDNTTYTNIATLDANTHDRWNTLTLATPATYRYYRLRGSGSAALCALAELQFYGVVLSDSTTTDLEALTCNVQVTVNDQTQSVTSAVTYQQSQTPTLTSISPLMGPSAGGDTVTLTGTGFITTMLDIEVLINGVSCAVSTATSTEITCVTGAAPDIANRKSSLESTVTINFAGQGDVIIGDITYFYVDKWSDINTWGGETPPREGDSVSIPTGQTILLDISPPRLKGITVEGALIFDDRDITLDCDYIFVNNGRLQIGTSANPIQNTITVTLYGDSSSPQLPIFGNKMIGLMEGILDIHGKERSYTWTTLDSTASIGDTSITVQQEVDWAPGEQIVIASSDHDPYSSETREILTATINSGTTIIAFTDPLVNSHYAGTQTIDSVTFEMRAEVGLLTRNVVIQGDDTSENLQYGAHIMAHSNTGDDSSIVRISYTEVRQAGQAFSLGRYPIHLHMIGNVKESSLTGNSVHHSYNRGISMHGVHFMTVQNNVAYWIMGHTILTEDGIETNNVIENNLVINTMASNSLLNTDLTPASFWIRNPNNIVTNNHAAGSDRYGFWFDLKGYVEGAASTSSICPDGEILGQFSDNQAHSSTRSGLRIYQEHIPRTYPCIDYSNYDTNTPIQSDFTNFLGWRNTEAAVIAETLGSVKFSNIKTADNIRAGIEISSGNTSPPDSWLVQDASIVGMSPDNAGDNSVYVAGGTRGLITPRVDYFLASSVSFSNFGSNMTAIETCSHCEHNSATDSGARTSFFEGLSFNNVNRRVKFNTPWKEILVDRDGTLTDNTAGGSGVVTYYYDHLDVPGCTINNAVYNGLVCDQTVTIRRIEFAGLVAFGTFQGIALNILRIENNPTAALGQIPYRPLTRQSWATPFVTGYTYQLSWANQADFSSLLITPSDVIETNDHSVTVIFNHTAYRETYDIFPSNLTLKSAIANTTVLWDSTTADSLQTGDWYHNVTGQELYIVVNGKNKQEMKVNAIGCRVNCPIPTSSIPKDGILRLWSNVTQWPNGQVPGDGVNIEIPGEWTVKLDVNSAKLGTLHIMGDMLFDDTVDNLVLTAERIWVEGQLFIGTSTDALYTNNAKILLTGNRTSQDLLIGNVQDVGNKVLAVTGNLTMLGETVNYVYVRLQAPAYAGDMTITVPSGVDWEVGNQIVISPTQRAYNEYEVKAITAINAGVITLNSSLQYYHFGATSVTKSTSLGDLDMRAEVGLLTRNIVIEGADEDLWGGRIYVGEIYDSELNSYSRGRVNMAGVEMVNLGQPNTTQAGVTFDSLVSSNNDGCVVSQCVVRDSLGIEMEIIGSTGITIDSNIFFRSFNTQVLFEEESTGIQFTNNLLIGNEDPSLLNETGNAFGASIYANVELLSSEISGNIISGCYQQCLFTLGGDCTSQADGPYTVYDNIAHSGQVGWLVNSPNEDCNAITDFTGYKLEQGIATMFESAQLQASNIIISDTEIGLSLNTGGILDATTISFTNSYSAGVTPTGVLDSYNNTAECSNLTGILLPVSLTSSKSIPPSSSQLPWYKVESDHIWQSTFTMSGVTFENFDDTVVSNCTSNFAIRSNHYASDASASTQLSNMTLINVADANKLYFEKPNEEWININACGGWFCTGLSNILVRDLDGTFVNNNKPTSLMPANNGTIDSTTCTYNKKNNANICTDKGWGLLTFESLDSDDLTRVLSPVQVTRTNYSNQLNSYMDHLWDGTSSLSRRSRFHAVVQSGLQYQIVFVSSVPEGLRWSLQGALSTESVSVSYGYVNPQSMRVTHKNGTIIKPIVAKLAQDKVIKTTDTCGTNVYNIDNKTISIQITGEGTCRLDIVNTNSIKGSLKYSVGIDDFFSQNGPTIFVNKIATLLNINSSLVRIVDVKSGSTLLTFFVDSTYQDNTTESDTAAKAELTSMVNTLTNAVSSGDLSILDSTILAYSFDIILLRPPANKSKTTRNVVIIVAAVFVGILALIFGAYFAYRRYAKKKEIPYRIELNKRRPRLHTESSGSMHTENPLVSTSRFDMSASPYIVRDISISRPRDLSPDHV